MLINPQRRTYQRIKKLEDILEQCESQNDIRLWKRVKSILLFLKNKRPNEISDLIDVGLKSVYRWLNHYDKEGVKGLYEGNHTGRISLLNRDQLTRLEDILNSGPVAYGLTTGIWTCPTVQHVIEKEFGISYHHNLRVRFFTV